MTHTQLNLSLDVAPTHSWIEDAERFYHDGISLTQIATRLGQKRSKVYSELVKRKNKGLRQRQTGLLKIINEAINDAPKAQQPALRAWLRDHHAELRQLDVQGDRPLLTKQRLDSLAYRELHAGCDARELFGHEHFDAKLQDLRDAPPVGPDDYAAAKERRDRAKRRKAEPMPLLETTKRSPCSA